MGYIFDEWKDALDEFKDSVQNDLEEIHKQKAEIQQLKAELYERMEGFKFYRDENCLVISAPKVIIGNVDQSGDLVGREGEVIIKGRQVALDGVGSTGQILSRAPSIRQIAVDPGTDGMESVVQTTSEIVNHACNISIESSDATDAFSMSPGSAGKGGIRIHADKSLQLEASVSSEKRKEQIESTVENLTTQISFLEELVETQKENVNNLFARIGYLYDKNDELNGDDPTEKSGNTIALTEVLDDMESSMPFLFQATTDYIKTISQLAEANRQKTALETEKDGITEGDDFKDNTTEASLEIRAESISVATTDGDGNLHTNDEAGITISTPRMAVAMLDDDGALIEDSLLSVRAEHIDLLAIKSENEGANYNTTGSVTIASKEVNIEAMDYEVKDDKIIEKELTADSKVTITAKSVEVSTAGPSNVERDDDGNLSGGEFKAEGDVLFKTKTFTVESLDYEVADGELKMKALTEGGEVSVRAEKTGVLAADNEGKATGSISLNAKAVKVKSMDVDAESLEDSALAEGSTMLLLSEKMYMGSKSDDIKSKKVQMVSEEIGAFADNTFEAQQGDGKAAVQLADGKAAVGGDETQVYGTTTINKDTEVKGQMKASTVSGDTVKASSSFSSPNISDGTAVGGGGGGGSLSTKLSKENVSE